MKYLLLSKLRASCIHLILSALVAGSVLLASVWLWYPPLLLNPTGASKIYLIVLAVDVCLGPFLTFVVFNKQKKELRRDLLIIALIQIGALGYGVYTLAKARPVYFVYSIDRFEVVQANELAKDNINDAVLAEFKTLPLLGPKWISTRLPENEDENIGLAPIVGGADIAQLPKLYSKLEQSKDLRIERAKSMDTLKQYNPGKHNLIDSLVNEYKAKGLQIAFVPITARKKDISVLVNSENGDVLQIVDLNPWE